MNFRRIKKLQSALAHPLLIKKKENLLYLTGRSFMNGYLLVSPGKPVVFFGDGLEKVEGLKSDRLKNIALYLKRARVLELENEFTFAEYDYIKRKTKNEKRRAKTLLRHVRSPADLERMAKDVKELKLMGKAMQIAAKTFTLVKKVLTKRRWTEIELAQFIKKTGLRLGAEDLSFPPIVAAGENAAVPHHVPSKRRLKPNESIIIDMGFKYRGYCSDFTRTVFLGNAPRRLVGAYDQVEKSYKGAMEFMGAGVTAGRVYSRAVDILAEKKLDKYFIHNLGHGTGLEIHELPNLSPNSRDVLRENMVTSIEPGVYLPRIGGIRIEDLIFLDKGKARKFINISTKLKDNVL